MPSQNTEFIISSPKDNDPKIQLKVKDLYKKEEKWKGSEIFNIKIKKELKNKLL